MAAKPNEIKPKGIIKWFLKFLNLLIDFIPQIIGTTTACRWAKNKRRKNKLI
tara:strand:- start:263 stop:418 length:156 start_codon:yes stop_codon:yes gene_type:complete